MIGTFLRARGSIDRSHDVTAAFHSLFQQPKFTFSRSEVCNSRKTKLGQVNSFNTEWVTDRRGVSLVGKEHKIITSVTHFIAARKQEKQSVDLKICLQAST